MLLSFCTSMPLFSMSQARRAPAGLFLGMFFHLSLCAGVVIEGLYLMHVTLLLSNSPLLVVSTRNADCPPQSFVLSLLTGHPVKGATVNSSLDSKTSWQCRGWRESCEGGSE